VITLIACSTKLTKGLFFCFFAIITYFYHILCDYDMMMIRKWQNFEKTTKKWNLRVTLQTLKKFSRHIKKTNRKKKVNFACYTTITVLSLLLLLKKSHIQQKKITWELQRTKQDKTTKLRLTWSMVNYATFVIDLRLIDFSPPLKVKEKGKWFLL